MAIKTMLGTLLLAASLGGCAFSEDTATIAYTPAASAPPVAGAQPVALSVVDARTTNRTRISMKKNGYGMDGASIRADRPVPDIVRDALSGELQNRGVTLSSTGTPVTVAVQTFYANFGADIPTGSAIAPAMYKGDVHGLVTLAVTAGPAGGYHQTYTGLGNADVFLTSGKNAARVLDAGLHDVLAKMFADPGFVAAIARPATS